MDSKYKISILLLFLMLVNFATNAQVNPEQQTSTFLGFGAAHNKVIETPTDTFKISFSAGGFYNTQWQHFDDTDPFGTIVPSHSLMFGFKYNNKYFQSAFTKDMFVSKGYFGDYVELRWELERYDNLVKNFYIYRKVYGSTGDSIRVAILGADQRTWKDNYAEAGVMYQYTLYVNGIIPYNQRFVNYIDGVGFRIPTGNVAGRVTYSGGTAVKGVQIIAETEDNFDGSSLYLNGTDSYLAVSPPLNNEHFKFTTDFMFQAWIKPENTGVVCIFQKGTQYKITNSLGIVTFTAGGQSVSVNFTQKVDTFFNITAMRSATELKLIVYYNLDEYFTQTVAFSGTTTANNDEIFIGKTADNLEYFKGGIDEIRIWHKSFTEEELLYQIGRIISGNEIGLSAYYRLDENFGENMYDISTRGFEFNEKHGYVHNCNWSNDLPYKRQLAVKGITDVNGNYLIAGIPYATKGSVYRFIPVYDVHLFDPLEKSLFIGPGSTTHNHIDFVDIASFRVTGNIKYKDTYFPVRGVELYVDGQIVVNTNGTPVTTDAYGNYAIDVPIGYHYISVGMRGHDFSIVRFPETGNWDFQQSVSGVNFIDATLVKVIGKVAGGPRELAKPKGLGQTLNNLGFAEITMTTQKEFDLTDDPAGINVTIDNQIYQNENVLTVGETDFTINKLSPKSCKIFPDPETGEFEAYLLPEKYVITNIKAGNYVFDNSFHFTVDLMNATLSQKTEIDSIKIGESITAYGDTIDILRIDSINYHHNLDLVYRVTPSINVTNKSGKSYFGETTITAKDNVEVPILNDDGTINTAYPIFKQRGNYNVIINVFEKYINVDNANEEDIVPVNDGIVEIQNFLAIDKEKNSYDIDPNGIVKYSFSGGLPNITTGGIGDYLLSLNVIARTGQNNAIATPWLPNGEVFKAYLIGGMPTGSNFVTSGPNELITILRDPPGSESFATFEKGNTLSSTHKTTFNFSDEVGANLEVDLGTKMTTFVGLGAGVITETEQVNNLEAGFTQKLAFNGENTETHTVTTTKTWTTSSSSDFVGSDGDLFVGHATNLVYGISRQVTLMHQSFLAGEGRVGIPFDYNGVSYDIGLTNGIRVAPEVSTTFMFTKYHIENYLIPNLKTLRNNILLNSPDVFQCVICDTENPNFGNPNTTGAYVYTGYSGGDTYNILIPADWDYTKTYTDSVAYFNQQIAGWTSYLEQNEREKVFSLSEENVSFDGGTTYSKSVQYSSSTESIKEFEWGIEAEIAHTVGFEILGCGSTVKLSTKKTFGGTNANGTTEETSVTYGFELNDGNAGDYISVDVRKPGGQQQSATKPAATGPVFRTIGGQTSCPYEDVDVTKYFVPGTILNNATMQREVPRITVENALATNVPSDLPALFNVQLANSSESEESINLILKIDETTNQDGALIEMDGSPIGNGRLITIPAGKTINKIIGVKQTQPNIYTYENLKLVLSSLCDDISDDVNISAYFQPVCTRVNMDTPEDKWVVNTNTDTTLVLNIKDYNLSNILFDKLLVQYKSASTSNWSTDMIFYVNEDDYLVANEPKTYINDNATLSYVLDVSSMQDRRYDVKVVSTCIDNTVNNSVIANGIKDIKRPQVFGTPQPANGILTPSDKVMITFDEPIFAGGLLPYNFSVRGVVNGNELRHQACLYFNGSNSYATAVNGTSLDAKSWTIEFWTRRGALTPGVIFAQGDIELGFDASNRFYAKTGNQTTLSTLAYTDMNKWYHFAVTFDSQAKVFNIYINDLFDREAIPQTSSFVANGRMNMGKSRNDDTFYNGFIHELRIWDKAIGFGTVYANMLKSFVGNEIGLIGYWTMDEIKGENAFDKARNRHAFLFDAEWRVFPNGQAMQFDGTSHIDITTSTSVVITPQMNFTLEFYFKAEPQTNTVMFSNGRGDGSDAAPGYTNIWVVGFDDAGKLYAKNNGTIMTLSGDYANDKWYHFALVLNRNSNAQVFIDGKMQTKQQSSVFGGMRGAKMAIGARMFWDGMGYTYDQHFKGMIDEFRIWKLAKTLKQIDMDMNAKLQGTEMGLVAYYPFDVYDAFGINLLPTLKDFSNQSPPVPDAIATNSTAQNVDVPNLKDARPVQDIGFGWVVNTDKIVIDINEPPALIEKCILEFTVDRVEDLQENRIGSPATWTAYIQQNSVIWQENELYINKEVFKEHQFSLKILNTGGTVQSYDINGIPAWLICSDPTGVLSPNSTKTLTFTINSGLNVGNYELSLYLTADFGYSEKFNLNVRVLKPAPNWTVNPQDFQYSMSIIAQLKVEGEFSIDQLDKVAVFANGECRGVANMTYVREYDMYQMYLTVYSNKLSEEYFDLHVWDASSGVEYTDIIVTAPGITTVPIPMGTGLLKDKYLFTSNELYGFPSEPLVISTKELQMQTLILNKGWNWLSFNLNFDNTKPLVSQLQGLESQSGDIIKSENQYTQYTPPIGWNGTLRGLNFKDMFMFYVSKKDTLYIKGTTVDVTANSLNIHENWNRISYLPQVNMPVKDAMASFNPNHGAVIKNQYSFAMYDKFMGWLGSLTYMKPNEGYMFYYKPTGGLPAIQTLTYPQKGSLSKGLIMNNEELIMNSEEWATVYRANAQNMTILAEVQNMNIESDDVLGIFAGENCVGYGKPIPMADGRTLFFVVANTDKNMTQLTFRLASGASSTLQGGGQDGSTLQGGGQISFNETTPFIANEMTGTLEKPFILNANSEITDIRVNQQFNNVSIYPNPFASKTNFEISIENQCDIRIEIFDVTGRRIDAIQRSNVANGKHTVEWEGSRFAKGVYTARISVGNELFTVKMVKAE